MNKFIIAPQEGPQLLYVTAKWCPVIFFGGARGGGKTSGSLIDFFQDVQEYRENWHGLLVRKTYPELQEVIRQGKEMFGPAGAEWVQFHKQFRFKEGSTLTLRSIESAQDAEKLQGSQFTWIAMDEATNQADEQVFRMLLACLRWTSGNVPHKRFRLTGNPGGAGHSWIKKLFIDPAPKGFEIIDDGDITRMYIPAKVTDNRILLEKDPEYIERLRHLGSPELVKAWLDGDWNVVLGAYFPEFSIGKHVIEPFQIPDYWTKFRAIDWGYSDHTCCLWIAVSDGSIEGIQKGALVVYRELYINEHTAEEVAELIDSLSPDDEEIAYTVLDPSAYGTRTKLVGRKGTTIAQVFKDAGIAVKRADNERLSGWNQIRQRLKTENLYMFKTCTELIRTLPILQHGKMRAEDVEEKNAEDHAADALRYGCMSRPIVSTPEVKEPKDVLVANNWLKHHGIVLEEFERGFK